ncbi:MAG: hypothetical protein GF372_06830 [Candidatus Marinimicrobia bacterium]|nr:hypothetical protein [Candidatus Neomarinimicrobiota bacterium]
MKPVTNQLNDSWSKVLTLIFAFGVFTVLSGCAATQTGTPAGVAEDIPNNANRIVLQQEEVPPADVYVDMINLFNLQDWEITYSEENLDTDNLEDILENEPLVFGAKKQITNDLALWISGNVEGTAAGGIMIASVKYAGDVDTPVADWNDARWTMGKAQTAFFEGLEAVRGARYDAMDFDVGVMVETEEQQQSG